jgi:hypothetical protein
MHPVLSSFVANFVQRADGRLGLREHGGAPILSVADLAREMAEVVEREHIGGSDFIEAWTQMHQLMGADVIPSVAEWLEEIGQQFLTPEELADQLRGFADAFEARTGVELQG